MDADFWKIIGAIITAIFGMIGFFAKKFFSDFTESQTKIGLELGNLRETIQSSLRTQENLMERSKNLEQRIGRVEGELDKHEGYIIDLIRQKASGAAIGG